METLALMNGLVQANSSRRPSCFFVKTFALCCLILTSSAGGTTHVTNSIGSSKLNGFDAVFGVAPLDMKPFLFQDVISPSF